MSQSSQPSSGSTIDEFLLQAKGLGIPKDQIERFLLAGYVPLPKQLQFHAAARMCDVDGGATKVGFGGARGPGKSHGVFAQVTLDDCQRVDGLKALFLRQTGASAQESFQDLIHKVLLGKVRYEYTNNVLKFRNGSRVILGGFHDDRDIEKYVGIEYDLIAIEELNQLTEDRVTKLLGSLRTSKEGWRPRLYASFNPGGLGHVFVKNLFIEPFVNKSETGTRFVPSGYKDNPFLNKEYIEYLENLQGDLAKKWREGNWDVAEGQFFTEWSRERHVVIPFGIPSSFKLFRAYDYGHENPATCAWYALDYDGRVWVYREKYWPKGHKTDVDKQAEEILKMSEGETYEYSIADPAIFSPHGVIDKHGGQTIAEVFARYGIIFIPGSNRRVDGWQVFHQYLQWGKDRDPKIRYFNTCKDSIRTIPNLIHDERKPEDVDTGGEDHAADRDRYFLMSLHEMKTPKPKSSIEKKLEEMQLKDAITSNLNNFYYG